MIVEKRYEYLGPRGLRWTEWFKVYECQTLEEAQKYVSDSRKVNNRNEEYRFI